MHGARIESAPIPYPEPWEPVDTPQPDWNSLEKASGGDILTDERAKQLGLDDKNDVGTYEPYRWDVFRNKENGRYVYVRSHSSEEDASQPVKVDSVIFPCAISNNPLSGNDFRVFSFPAIETYLNMKYLAERTISLRASYLADYEYDINPSAPLPRESKIDNHFLALVANQYDWCANAYPDDNPTEKMAEINRMTISGIQNWLAYARKADVLVPAQRGRRKKK